MAVTADYSIVPYEPCRQALSPLARAYTNPPAAAKAPAASLRDGCPAPPMGGRPGSFSRPHATYSSLRKFQTHLPAATGLVVDIFV
jgi:hypothetical protein